MRLTLLIPELIWPEPADRQTLDDLDLPALGTLLARGREHRQKLADDSSDALIARAFGLADEVPYAPLRLLGEGINPGEHHWACADPVHLRLHQERLILADGRAIDVEHAEATQLVAALNEYFADAGEFCAASADRWYLRLAEPAGFRTAPLSAMAGRRVDRLLPEEAGTVWLRRLLNEAQMLLHTHPANAVRETQGRMTINSLWLWGPGSLPKGLPKTWATVGADHPLARGLARATGADNIAVPDSLAALMSSPQTGPTLVLLEDLLHAVQYEDPDVWRAAIHRLEADWFAPLVAAIRAGRIELDLRCSTVYGLLDWQCRRADLWRLWRRPVSVGSVAARLADDKE
jgi:hypothetical protein